MSIEKYTTLGASATKAGLHLALENAGLTDSSGLFAQVIPDLCGHPEFYSFLHCDGAGTKSIVAYLLYKETGDPQVFSSLAQDSLVMNLDDIYCLGSPQTLALANTIGRNSRLISDEIIGALLKGYKETTEKLQDLGIPIKLTGGETADVGDVVRTLIVDSVIAGRIAKQNIINPANIIPGDIIVGLSSTGKAVYETTENSGIGSNGLTLARHSLINNKYAETYPEVVDPGIKFDQAYTGPFSLNNLPSELKSLSVAEALLSPTRTYAPVLTKIYEQLKTEIHAVIHLTGGGQTKVLRFGKGNLYLKDNLFPVPGIFQLIQKHGEVNPKEMFKVFNMGNRMELYLPSQHLKTVLEIAKSFAIEARQIGHVEKSPSDKNIVQIKSPLGEFEYQL